MKQIKRSKHGTNNHHEQLETAFPENRKPLNCYFDVKSCISLKTAYPNITTC